MAMALYWPKPWAVEIKPSPTIVLEKYGVRTVIQIFPVITG